MSESSLRTAVIICTRNRPEFLRRCLESIAFQDAQTQQLVVVDSSTDQRTRDVCQELAWSRLNYIHTGPGLTHQRNVGVRAVDESIDVVQFVDDDVVLDADYLRKVARVFANLDVVGCSGRMRLGAPARISIRIRWFGARPGSLTRFAHNVAPAGDAGVPVDWLIGCAMAYRRDVLSALQFDERRSGNGHGEDVDFSARAASFGTLWWEPAATFDHLYADTNRSSYSCEASDRAKHRMLLALDRVQQVRWWWVAIDAIPAVLAELIRPGTVGLHGRMAAAFGYCRGLVSAVSAGSGASRKEGAASHAE